MGWSEIEGKKVAQMTATVDGVDVGIRGSLLKRTKQIWVYGSISLTSLAVLLLFWYTNVFRDAILSNLELRNGTKAFAFWQRPPVRMVYKVYIFNYTNVEAFEAGRASRLRVEEVGPYVYRETLSRVNVRLHANGTVTYQERRSYEWEAGRSENETIVVPNVPLSSAIAFSRDINFVAQVGLTALLTTLRAKTFVQVTTGGFLWGYEDGVFRMARPILALSQRVPFEKFGIMAFKTGIDADRITMKTGSENLEELGLIERVNGATRRNVWGDTSCDEIYGTDGSMFPPHWIRDANTTLQVYIKDLCRTLPLRYHGRATSHGIPTLRYKLPTEAFVSSRTKDSCFCPVQDGVRICPPHGILNVSVCSFRSPILASFPHFYSADESLLKHVEGLHPRRDRHESYIDLHPRLGVPIGGWYRLQLNLEVRRALAVPFSGRLTDGMILPLIWIDAGVDGLPEPILDVLRTAYYTAGAVEAGFQWCSLIALMLSTGAFVAALKNAAAAAAAAADRPSRLDASMPRTVGPFE